MSDSALTYIQSALKLLKVHYQLVVLPLLILLLLFVVFFNIPYAKSDFQILNILLQYIRWGVLFITNFIIFITITLILRDKIYSTQEL